MYTYINMYKRNRTLNLLPFEYLKKLIVYDLYGKDVVGKKGAFIFDRFQGGIVLGNRGVSYPKTGFCRENHLLLIRKSPKIQKKKG